MDELTSTERKHLRGLAHALKPVVQLGGHGLTDAIVSEVDLALEHHELIKVRLVGERDDRTTVAEAIASRGRAGLVGTIGGVAILFRRHPEPEKRKILLPGEAPPKPKKVRKPAGTGDKASAKDRPTRRSAATR
jgi:RNA-binding protein